MSTPIPYWKSDKNYYSKKDSNYNTHILSILENLRIDKLINLSSLDGSYSIFFKRDKDAV